MKHTSKCGVILLAGGSGKRMQGVVEDKILAKIHEKEVFLYSFESFAQSEVVDLFVVVYKDDHQKKQLEVLCKGRHLPVIFVQGGGERQDSVFNGLQALPTQCKYVMIHDAARPLITQKNIVDLYDAVLADNAAVLAHRVTNTVKIVEGGRGDRLCKATDINRANLWATETPQAFQTKLILEAYKYVQINKIPITDDVSAASLCGHPITFVGNFSPNPKLTHPAHWGYVKFLLSYGH